MFILAFKMKESIEKLLDPSGLNPPLSPKIDHSLSQDGHLIAMRTLDRRLLFLNNLQLVDTYFFEKLLSLCAYWRTLYLNPLKRIIFALELRISVLNQLPIL